ncbi:MAG TPA: sulfatase-like hydrolase/transferase [Vicinamibacteria bacterium]
MALLAAAVALAAGALWWWRERPRPLRREAGLNVLLVTVDTLRADAVGAYGNARARTPWMDRLAREGVLFRDALAQNVVTLPSHANILSGRYPLAHGVRDNSGFRFPAGAATLATLLKARGYRTGAFVSAFPLDSRFGLDRGFDVYEDRFVNVDTRGAFAVQERSGPETVALAGRWIEAQGAGPWFAWVHVYEPHFPYRPPPDLAAAFPGDPYHGEVAAADRALAPLLRPLVEAGGAGRTFAVLTADHGEALGEHGEKTHGIFAYRGTLHVPLLLYAPRLLRPHVVDEPVRHVDIAPTVLDALGAERPDGWHGRSLLAAAAGHPAAAEPSYFEALSGVLNRGWAPLRGVVRGPLKYVDLPLPELYDRAADPGEERNLAAARPQELEQMRALLARLREGEQGLARSPESAETAERLRSLGYTAGGGALKEEYTEEDDPKRLIALDAMLEDVFTRHAAGDLEGALGVAKDLVRRKPDMPLSLTHLAYLQRETGDLRGAVDSLRRALALDPSDADTLSLLGAYLNEAGAARETVELLEPQMRAAEPDVDVLVALGVALAELGRREEALAVFARARQADPSNPMVLVNVGTVHLMADDRARARGALEEALALNPDVARAHNTLGVIAAREGRMEEAIARWKRAVELDPREFDTLYNLGLTLVRQGRGAEARSYLERFAQSAPPVLYARDVARVRAWLAGTGSLGARAPQG